MCKRIFMHRWRKWRLAELFLKNSSCLDFPGGLDGKESACNVGHLGSIPGLGSPEGENGNPLQYSCLGNPMDRGCWGLQCVGSQRVGRDWATKHCQLPDEAVNGYSRQTEFRSIRVAHAECPSWVVSVCRFFKLHSDQRLNPGTQHWRREVLTTDCQGIPSVCISVIVKYFEYHTCVWPPEEEMAAHSSTLAWRIPWLEEPGGLQSMGSQSQTRVSDWAHTYSVS